MYLYEFVDTKTVQLCKSLLINPLCMREGFGSLFVCVCLCVTKLGAMPFVLMLKAIYQWKTNDVFFDF